MANEDYTWRVTSSEAEGIQLEFGPKLADAPFDDDAKLQVLGKALVNLGTRLLTSTVNEDDQWDDDDDDFED